MGRQFLSLKYFSFLARLLPSWKYEDENEDGGRWISVCFYGSWCQEREKRKNIVRFSRVGKGWKQKRSNSPSSSFLWRKKSFSQKQKVREGRRGGGGEEKSTKPKKNKSSTLSSSFDEHLSSLSRPASVSLPPSLSLSPSSFTSSPFHGRATNSASQVRREDLNEVTGGGRKKRQTRPICTFRLFLTFKINFLKYSTFFALSCAGGQMLGAKKLFPDVFRGGRWKTGRKRERERREDKSTRKLVSPPPLPPSFFLFLLSSLFAYLPSRTTTLHRRCLPGSAGVIFCCRCGCGLAISVASGQERLKVALSPPPPPPPPPSASLAAHLLSSEINVSLVLLLSALLCFLLYPVISSSPFLLFCLFPLPLLSFSVSFSFPPFLPPERGSSNKCSSYSRAQPSFPLPPSSFLPISLKEDFVVCPRGKERKGERRKRMTRGRGKTERENSNFQVREKRTGVGKGRRRGGEQSFLLSRRKYGALGKEWKEKEEGFLRSCFPSPPFP